MRTRAALLGLLLIPAVVGLAHAAEPVGAPAPAWDAAAWHNLRPGRTSLQPGDLRGRVVYLLLFRPEDGAANARAFAAVARLHARYAGAVAFVAIQAAGTATPRAPSEQARRLGIASAAERPVPGRPPLRARYGAGEGPWAVLIDPRGIVRASRAVRPAGAEVRAIDALRARPPSNPLIGTPFGPLAGLRWLRPAGAAPRFAANRMTLLRWWTTNCPHCAASVPDLARLANKYRARGLGFVGIYHRKSARRWSDGAIAAAFQRLGGGPHGLAVDEGWRMLKPFMQRGRLRRATSISILVDDKGVIRWVHPGPRIHTATTSRYAGPARDLRALDAFLDARLPSALPAGR